MKHLLLAAIFMGMWADVLAQSRNEKYVVDSAHSVVTPLRTFNTALPPAKAMIASDFHAQGLGFFCKQELKLEKAHVPVVFRLGSVSYCNMLEQKPGYKQ